MVSGTSDTCAMGAWEFGALRRGTHLMVSHCLAQNPPDVGVPYFVPALSSSSEYALKKQVRASLEP
jgi:hypothetical protein